MSTRDIRLGCLLPMALSQGQGLLQQLNVTRPAAAAAAAAAVITAIEIPVEKKGCRALKLIFQVAAQTCNREAVEFFGTLSEK